MSVRRGEEVGDIGGQISSALAYWVPAEAAGSALQLLINLGAITLAGVLTLVAQRVHQERLLRT
jgi:hypothetical protein